MSNPPPARTAAQFAAIAGGVVAILGGLAAVAVATGLSGAAVGIVIALGVLLSLAGGIAFGVAVRGRR